MKATENTPISFDPYDPRIVEEGVPFDVLARIRREDPVYRTPRGNWYLSRYADVESALKDVDTFRAELGPITGIPAGVTTIPEDQHYLSEIPEPRHGMVRRLFNSVLAVHRMRQVEPAIEAECQRLMDGLLGADVADLHGGYAAAIPAFTMAQLMGLGPEAPPLFMQWSMDGSLMSRPATPGVPPEGPATHVFFEARVAEQRALDEPPMRLHALWDNAAGSSSEPSAVSELARRLTRRPALQRTALPELQQRPYGGELTFQRWAREESYPLAVRVAYQGGTLAAAHSEDHAVVLSSSYLASAAEWSVRRVVLSGYRLADVLAVLMNGAAIVGSK